MKLVVLFTLVFLTLPAKAMTQLYVACTPHDLYDASGAMHIIGKFDFEASELKSELKTQAQATLEIQTRTDGVKRIVVPGRITIQAGLDLRTIRFVASAITSERQDGYWTELCSRPICAPEFSRGKAPLFSSHSSYELDCRISTNPIQRHRNERH